MMNSDWDALPLYLAKMTSPEIKQSTEAVKIVLLAVGSIEQHGAHLPIETDLATAEYLAREAVLDARRASGAPIALIAPSVPYGGPGLAMDGWAGTIALRPEVLIEVIIDIGHAVAAMGFPALVLLNGCFGNVPALTLAAQKLKKQVPQNHVILIDSVWAMPEIIREVRETELGGTGHAGEVETSTHLVIDPEHVKMQLARKELLHHPSSQISFDFDSSSPFYWPLAFHELTEHGVIGDPQKASAEKGKVILEANVGRISRALQQISELV